MKVDRGKAMTAEHAGKTFYFCSNHCLHTFETDPDRYAQQRGGPAGHQAAHGHA